MGIQLSERDCDRVAAGRVPRFPRNVRIRGRYRYTRLRWRVLMTVIDFVGTAIFWAARRVRQLAGQILGRPRSSHLSCATAETQDDPRVILVV